MNCDLISVNYVRLIKLDFIKLLTKIIDLSVIVESRKAEPLVSLYIVKILLVTLPTYTTRF